VNEPSPGAAGSVDARARTVRFVAVAVVWFGGLAAGFVGMLAAAAHYGCGIHDSGLACERSGSVCGALIVVAVVAVVVAVTMLTFDRPARRVLVVSGIGFALLAVLFALAAVLLSTL
jgi:hypothetical protein